jgi:hypothetical protein
MRQEISIEATYLDVDEILRTKCNSKCPWLGLFHVEMPVSDVGTFLQDPAGYLIPALQEALEVAGKRVPDLIDLREQVSIMQFQLWGSKGLQQLTTCPDECPDTCVEQTCYVCAAFSPTPMLAGPVWVECPEH